MKKKPAKKPSTTNKTVQVVADGTNRVVLIFPEETRLKGKKKLSIKDLAKVLSAVQTNKVEGQNLINQIRGAIKGEFKKMEVRTPAAIAGVRG